MHLVFAPFTSCRWWCRWRCRLRCVCVVYGCVGVNNHICECQDTGVCTGCVVCYQLRFMQICLAAEPSPTVDFFVNSFCSVVLPFVLLSCTTTSTHPPTKQIKLFACASKSICVYQIVGLQTKNRKIAHTQSRKPNKNKDYCFAAAVLLQGKKIKT